jgi:hypothetical protein
MDNDEYKMDNGEITKTLKMIRRGFKQEIATLRADLARVREERDKLRALTEWKAYPENTPKEGVYYLVQTHFDRYYLVTGGEFEDFEQDADEKIVHFQKPSAPPLPALESEDE